ncbi:archaetidylserine decarboxylase [Marinicellulosiphila megalodicopiae]|uniref:archaetidylserine decarboxylase n=1 Tax=Marinicellulosiphila megalodicopiae TaxID=2724896 RepID=UPI003BAFCF7F
MTSLKTFLFIFFQYIVPQHLISRIVGKLAASENIWIKTKFISIFAKKFGITLEQAQIESFDQFKSFNEFFTRALKKDARKICDDNNGFACPADGAISQLGDIKQGRIFQAKGFDFTCEELLAGENVALYQNGKFATVYLSPKDYHRVHMPCDGKLTAMTYIPGDLFSVNTQTSENVPRLFSRNERVVAHFETPHGPMAMVLVGAMVVASIETVWAGLVAPLKRQIKHQPYPLEQIELKKGEEMGRFLLGSTVVLLFGNEQIQWLDSLESQSEVTMGEKIAKI